MVMLMNSRNDIFILGSIHTLLALQSVKEEGEDMNDVQWEILIENQRRNLENPEIEECLKHAKEEDVISEDLR